VPCVGARRAAAGYLKSLPGSKHPSEWISGVGKRWAERAWVEPPFIDESGREDSGGRKGHNRVGVVFEGRGSGLFIHGLTG